MNQKPDAVLIGLVPVRARGGWAEVALAALLACGPVFVTTSTLAGPGDAPPDFDELWEMREPEATRQVFLELLAAYADAPSAWILELKTQIARTHSRMGEYEQAHAVLDSVEPALTGGMIRPRVRYLLERGRTFRLAGDSERARPLFAEAFRLADALGEDNLAIDAAHMLALVAPEKSQAGSWNRLALDRAGASDDPRARRWVGSLTYNMGWDAFESGRPREALPLFEQSRDYFRGRGAGPRARSAQYAVGRVLRALERNEEALQLQLELERENAGAATLDGFNFEELAELYLLRGEDRKAQGYFAKAWPLLSKVDWLVREHPERLRRIEEFAAVAADGSDANED